MQAIKLGAFDFLKKPIPAEKLQQLLSEIGRERSAGNLRPNGLRRSSGSDIDREIIGGSAPSNASNA